MSATILICKSLGFKANFNFINFRILLNSDIDTINENILICFQCTYYYSLFILDLKETFNMSKTLPKLLPKLFPKFRQFIANFIIIYKIIKHIEYKLLK